MATVTFQTGVVLSRGVQRSLAWQVAEWLTIITLVVGLSSMHPVPPPILLAQRMCRVTVLSLQTPWMLETLSHWQTRRLHFRPGGASSLAAPHLCHSERCISQPEG